MAGRYGRQGYQLATDHNTIEMNPVHGPMSPTRSDPGTFGEAFKSGTWKKNKTNTCSSNKTLQGFDRRSRLQSYANNFFGVGDDCQEDSKRWERRRSRHLSRRHGGLKKDVEERMEEAEMESIMGLVPHVVDPFASGKKGKGPVRYQALRKWNEVKSKAKPRAKGDEIDGARRAYQSSQAHSVATTTGTSSTYKRALSRQLSRQRSKRQSVAKMGWDALKSTLGRPQPKTSRSQDTLVHQRPPMIHSRSFAPANTMMDEIDDSDMDFSFFSPTFMSPMSEDRYDDVFFDFSPKAERRNMPLPSRPSQSPIKQSSDASSLPNLPGMETLSNQAGKIKDAVKKVHKRGKHKMKDSASSEQMDDEPLMGNMTVPSPGAGDKMDKSKAAAFSQMMPTGIGWRKKKEDRFDPPLYKSPPPEVEMDLTDSARPQKDIPGRRNKIAEKVMAAAFNHSERRQIGKGLVGRILNRSYRKQRLDSEVKEQLESIEDHRPYFTYWLTTVHVVILIISLVFYGFAPIGFTYTQRRDLVLQANLVVETVGYMEPDNFWIGPRPADLIHLGAKYSPCMHRDEQVYVLLADIRKEENNTGCCIRTDNAGCVQTNIEECSTSFATFAKWSIKRDSPSNRRTSGPVCGQDYRTCKVPASVKPNEWPDDITKWPICKEGFEDSELPHTTCDLTGRPCCIGIDGTCKIVSQQYCDFVKGYFHPEAALCSQVDCLNDVCGLIPFGNKEKPDQIYRLWLSLFLHAGIFHCILSIIMQMTILRDLEKLAGCLRIAIIYLVSGIGGNLMSAIFIPYRAEVGPAGAQFGLLACLVVEVLQNFQILRNPGSALGKLLLIISALFVLGLLPWIDNYAHLGGFICGTLLSFIFLPYVYFGEFDRNRKRIQIVISTILLLLYFILMFIIYYLKPLRDCKWCSYFNCVPLTEDFCSDMDVKLTDELHPTR
ncbi:inactive rhomboid protein 1-like isoform X2 [Anneissia japonica]|uniref:inactive rhomboid protein 1-like isoform X2 n=1 Tax=Anneissia japonica TaxID=1529436 RepID=UPI001425B08F|nr:inactive rhomboid protein 1-like isoform X2 [Anneissia japonica]